jgi:hypothetical protein
MKMFGARDPHFARVVEKNTGTHMVEEGGFTASGCVGRVKVATKTVKIAKIP